MSGGSELETLWSKLVEAVGRASPFVRSYFIERPSGFPFQKLVDNRVRPRICGAHRLVDNAKNHTLLQTKLSELGHPNMQVKFVQAAAPPHRPVEPPPAVRGPAAQPAASVEPPRQNPPAVSAGKIDFRNDPLIQKALEIFKGQIVDVRSEIRRE